MRLPADDLFDTLSDDEAKKVLAFGRDVLGRRTDKTGAAALLLLRNVNLHDAADAVVKELLSGWKRACETCCCSSTTSSTALVPSPKRSRRRGRYTKRFDLGEKSDRHRRLHRCPQGHDRGAEEGRDERAMVFARQARRPERRIMGKPEPRR